MSYEVYLLHANALAIAAYVFGHVSRHERLLIVIGIWLTVLPASWVVYRFIDKPIDRLRVIWVRSRRVEPRGAGVVGEARHVPTGIT
jgi:peptidoglycan/LPS O-acetylase OafA/YrhL